MKIKHASEITVLFSVGLAKEAKVICEWTSRNQQYHNEKKGKKKWQKIKNIFKEKHGGGSNEEDTEYGNVDGFSISTVQYESLDKVGRMNNFQVDFLLQLTYNSLPKTSHTIAFVPTDFYRSVDRRKKLFEATKKHRRI